MATHLSARLTWHEGAWNGRFLPLIRDTNQAMLGIWSRLARTQFLRTLSEVLVKPVMPDQQDVGYRSTQAVANFLSRHRHLNIDGIRFPSAQARGGTNIILFNKAAKVKSIDIPQGTKVSAFDTAQLYLGGRSVIQISEGIPSGVKRARSEQHADIAIQNVDRSESQGMTRDHDRRAVSLQVDPYAIEIHEVMSIGFRTRQRAVRRNRLVDDIPF